MKSNTLVIQKLHLDVFTGEEEAPEALLEKAMEMLKARFLPLLEARIEEIGGEEGHFIVDKLELDHQLEAGEDWPTMLVDVLVEQLAVVTAREEPAPGQLKDPGRVATNFPEKTFFQHGQDRMVAIWVHFLSTGRLPWWKASIGVASLSDLIAKEEFSKSLWLAPEIQHLLASSGNAALRLAQNLSTSQFQIMVKSLGRVGEEILQYTMSREEDETRTRMALWPSVLRAMPELLSIGATGDADSASWLPPVLRKLHSEAEMKIWVLEIAWFRQQYGDFPEELEREIAALEARLAEFGSAIKSGGEGKVSFRQEVPPHSGEPVLPATQARIPEEEIYLDCAGLVMLHPFLPSLFQNLGLVDEANEWLDEKARPTALHLLGRLAAGNWNSTEDQLIVPRLLAGLSMEEVIPPLEDAPEFSRQLEDEIASILEILHENWPPMRSCSWESLAVDFLQRPGKLSRSGAGHWKLQVESRMVDVLLRRLGWGLSPVKLPWMESMLMVEWG